MEYLLTILLLTLTVSGIIANWSCHNAFKINWGNYIWEKSNHAGLRGYMKNKQPKLYTIDDFSDDVFGECASLSRKTIKSRTRDKGRQRVTKDYTDEYKTTHPCIVCGEADICCLDFHHVNESSKHKQGGKRMHISKMKDLPLLIREIAKCVILCANCHRKVHAGCVDITLYVDPSDFPV